MTQAEIMKKIRLNAQEHYDSREKIFDINDIDKETIAVESYVIGADAAIQLMLAREKVLMDATKAAEIMFDKMLSDLALKEKEPGILLRENPFAEALAEVEEWK